MLIFPFFFAGCSPHRGDVSGVRFIYQWIFGPSHPLQGRQKDQDPIVWAYFHFERLAALILKFKSELTYFVGYPHTQRAFPALEHNGTPFMKICGSLVLMSCPNRVVRMESGVRSNA